MKLTKIVVVVCTAPESTSNDKVVKSIPMESSDTEQCSSAVVGQNQLSSEIVVWTRPSLPWHQLVSPHHHNLYFISLKASVFFSPVINLSLTVGGKAFHGVSTKKWHFKTDPQCWPMTVQEDPRSISIYRRPSQPAGERAPNTSTFLDPTLKSSLVHCSPIWSPLMSRRPGKGKHIGRGISPEKLNV